MANKRNIEQPGSALVQGEEEAAAADADETSAAEAAALSALTVEIVDPPLLPAYTPHYSTGDAPTNALPDASQVDPTKIPSAVLTKQGWVLPSSLEERAKN